MCQTYTRPKKGSDSEFNSIHFGMEINKSLKFLRHKIFFSITNSRKFFQEVLNLLEILIPKNFLGLNNVKHLLISIPKCIELNFESEPKMIFFGCGFGSWVLVWTQTQTQTKNLTRPKPRVL